jgi:6,7-dimethyl-8-ribityllumazine synthase
MKVIEGDLKIQPKTKICIISTRFNHFITDRLVEGAKDTYIRLGGDEFDVDLVLAPGAFEIPFVLEKVLSKGTYDGVCCLGAVIRGETPHFDYVSAEATKGIAAVSLKHGKPVTYGILTVNKI